MGGNFRAIFVQSAAPAYFALRYWSSSDQHPYDSWLLHFLIAVCLSASVAFVWAVILYPKYYSPLKHLPKAPVQNGSFLHGQLWRILAEWPGMPMRDWINNVPNDGIIRITTVFNNERLIITSPQALSEVLVTRSYDWDKPKAMRQVLGRILGFGVLLASGPDHKMQRKALAPAFTYRQLRNAYPLFWAEALRLSDVVQSKIISANATTGSIPWASLLNRATLDIITLAIMGRSFNALDDSKNVMFLAYRSLFATSANAKVEAVLETLENLLPVAMLASLPLKRNRAIATNTHKIRRIVENIVHDRISLSEADKSRDFKDILGVCVHSAHFSTKQLVDQLLTMFAAGHETTATATCWILHVLCQRPDIQDKLREEVCRVLPGDGEPAQVNLADLMDKAEYLHAVCNEVLRLYPPVPLTRRTSCRDTEILGHYIPKNSDILLVPAAVNVSMELWGEDALEFRPERFLGQGRANSGGAVSNYANMTFLHGPRSCIGQSFAKAELACLIAVLVRKFGFEFADERDMQPEILPGFLWKMKGDFVLRTRVLHPV